MCTKGYRTSRKYFWKRAVISAAVFALSVFVHFLSAHADNWNRVRWVADGDTIVLQDGTRVRYIGINAPEIAHADAAAEPYGYAAKSFNRKLVLDRRIRIEFDEERFDRYGRTLAYVFLRDNTFINAEMVRHGYAYCVAREPNQRYEELLLDLQHDAMAAGEGIWHNRSAKKEQYLGSRRSKRFHRMTCPFGARINRRNRIIFHSRWDAFWEGYAPGKKCSHQP